MFNQRLIDPRSTSRVPFHRNLSTVRCKFPTEHDFRRIGRKTTFPVVFSCLIYRGEQVAHGDCLQAIDATNRWRRSARTPSLKLVFASNDARRKFHRRVNFIHMHGISSDRLADSCCEKISIGAPRNFINLPNFIWLC